MANNSKWYYRLFDSTGGKLLRDLCRSIPLLTASFGFGLSGEQTAAVGVVTLGVIRLIQHVLLASEDGDETPS